MRPSNVPDLEDTTGLPCEGAMGPDWMGFKAQDPPIKQQPEAWSKCGSRVQSIAPHPC